MPLISFDLVEQWHAQQMEKRKKQWVSVYMMTVVFHSIPPIVQFVDYSLLILLRISLKPSPKPTRILQKPRQVSCAVSASTA